jgi:hypothetical protein
MAYLLAGKYETAVTLFRERIVLVPRTDFSRAPLASPLVISARSTRPGVSGANSWRSIRNTRSASISAGYLSRDKRMSRGSSMVLRRRDCRPNKLTSSKKTQEPNFLTAVPKTKIQAEIRSIRRSLRVEKLPLVGPIRQKLRWKKCRVWEYRGSSWVIPGLPHEPSGITVSGVHSFTFGHCHIPQPNESGHHRQPTEVTL